MDQMIRFRCECGQKLKATRDLIGKKVRCTNCVRTHLVPESDHLPPKNTVPESMAKNTSTEQGQEVIKSKQQDSAASKPKRLITPKPNFASEKSNLIIPDEMAAKEPSLLPTSDDSDSRFKLDPKFDPEPSESPLNPTPTSNLGFDFGESDIETEPTVLPPFPQQPNFKRPTSKSKLALGIATAVVGLILLLTTVFFIFGDSAYPKEFSEQPEVRNYVKKIEEFRKSQRTLKIVSEAYVKSKSPTVEEREQIEAYNRSIEPLANQQIKLDEALELFKASEHEKARSALIAATQTLDEKIPELESKANDFSSKLR